MVKGELSVEGNLVNKKSELQYYDYSIAVIGAWLLVYLDLVVTLVWSALCLRSALDAGINTKNVTTMRCMSDNIYEVAYHSLMNEVGLDLISWFQNVITLTHRDYISACINCTYRHHDERMSPSGTRSRYVLLERAIRICSLWLSYIIVVTILLHTLNCKMVSTIVTLLPFCSQSKI